MQNVENILEPIRSPHWSWMPDVQYQSNDLDTSVLESMMPACVLVNEKNELVRTYGDCSSFLSIPAGAATLDIFMLLRNDLKIPVSTVLQDSRTRQTRRLYTTKCRSSWETAGIYLHRRAADPGPARPEDQLYGDLLCPGKTHDEGDMKHYQIDTAAAQRISDLEQELRKTKDNLRQTVTELESVNAELQAANEELLTANEELQSSNEELQSVNEELYTVNSEYQSKVTELAGLNDDMANFLSTTLVGILMVDRDLNIRKFTEYISTEFNVVDQDVGRSLRYISYNFATIDLIKQCRQVSGDHGADGAALRFRRRQDLPDPDRALPGDGQQAAEGSALSRKETPMQGLVLTFVDTTKQVEDQEQIEEMARALRQAVKSGQEKETFLSHMSHDMRTPMTAIFGLTQLSLQEKDLRYRPDNLEKIQTSSNYLLDLIEEILETSRINAGKVVSVSTRGKGGHRYSISVHHRRTGTQRESGI